MCIRAGRRAGGLGSSTAGEEHSISACPAGPAAGAWAQVAGNARYWHLHVKDIKAFAALYRCQGLLQDCLQQGAARWAGELVGALSHWQGSTSARRRIDQLLHTIESALVSAWPPHQRGQFREGGAVRAWDTSRGGPGKQPRCSKVGQNYRSCSVRSHSGSFFCLPVSLGRNGRCIYIRYTVTITGTVST